MKKTLYRRLSLFISLFLCGCGARYQDVSQYNIVTNDPNGFSVEIEGKAYTTVENSKWFPLSDQDFVLGRCEYNGITLIYATSSPICYYIDNIKSELRPSDYVYYTDEVGTVLQSIQGSQVDLIELRVADMGIQKTIQNKEIIAAIFEMINNESEYIDLSMENGVAPDRGFNWIGVMRCYDDDLPGLCSEIEIAKFDGAVYYVIRQIGTHFVCVKDKGFVE